jgi:hypothetical protein
MWSAFWNRLTRRRRVRRTLAIANEQAERRGVARTLALVA